MIEYFLLLLGVPVGILCAIVTKDEKEIYSKNPYFPILIWILAGLAAVFLTLDKVLGFTFLFMFLVVFSWWKYKHKS